MFLDALPEAPLYYTYICIGSYCWGKSKSAVLAARIARENGSKGEYIIHLVNEEAEVDQINGTLYYNSRVKGIRIHIARFKQS